MQLLNNKEFGNRRWCTKYKIKKIKTTNIYIPM